MLWIEEGQGRRRIYTVMSSKQLTGSQEGWIVVRGMVDEQGQFVGWEILPAYASRRYNTHEEAMQVLDETIRANHLQRADCGTCWHLRNHGQTCDFFLTDTNKCGNAALRCEKCLSWGRVPPG